MDIVVEVEEFVSRIVTSIMPLGAGAVLSYVSVCLLYYFGPYQALRDGSESEDRRRRVMEKLAGIRL
jgi:hypothetical protein